MITLTLFHPASGRPFATGKTGFSIKFKNMVSGYSPLSIFVLPEEKLRIEVDGHDRSGQYAFFADAGKVMDSSRFAWTWQAPAQTGLYVVRLMRAQPDDSMLLNIFVMVPYQRLQGEYLNGYRIGRYPKILYKGLPSYRPPRGFIEVTEENIDTRLSPHFTLAQFVCKQDGGYPKYAVVRELLLLKLELILQKVNEAGYEARTFAVLSGYRTPYYNKAIGNVKYSRHQWGGAADIYIDENPCDGVLDDLNRDGLTDWRDAAVIYDIIDDMFGRKYYEPFIGGLARYRKTDTHGPFVHVDVRGFHARWGDGGGRLPPAAELKSQ